MIPVNPRIFSGNVFAEKYKLKTDDFWIDRGYLYCPSMPNMTGADIADCVISPVYSITPQNNLLVLGQVATISITGAPLESVSLYAYDAATTPTAEDELEAVVLDEAGQGVAMFTPDSIGEFAVRGVTGEYAGIVSLIKVVA